MGQNAAADSVIQIARAHDDELSAFESLQVALFEAYREGDLPKGARACRALAARWPTFSFCAGLSTLQIGELGLRGNFGRELESARETRQLHPAWLPPFEGEVRALVSLNRGPEADALVQNRIIEASRYPAMPPASDVWSTSGSVLTYLALEARAHGHRELYRKWIQSAVAWHGEHLAEKVDLDPLATVRALYYAQRWQEAWDHLSEVYERPSDSLEAAGYRAALAARLGDRDETQRLDREFASYEPRDMMGANLLWRARIAALRGDNRRAVELLRQAHTNGWPFNIWHHVDLDFEALRDFPPFQEFLEPVG